MLYVYQSLYHRQHKYYLLCKVFFSCGWLTGADDLLGPGHLMVRVMRARGLYLFWEFNCNMYIRVYIPDSTNNICFAKRLSHVIDKHMWML